MKKDILNKLTIRGFKSICELKEFKLKNLNILIGANGAGKSNLISFFKMLSSMSDENLDEYIRENGGISDILYNGRKTTSEMQFEMMFGLRRGYKFTIKPNPDESAAITEECIAIEDERYDGYWCELGRSGNANSLLVREATTKFHGSEYCEYVYNIVKSCQIYQFHDTSLAASVRGWEIVEDNKKLRSNASNLASFLLRLREEDDECYQEILSVCRSVMPYLKNFLLNVKEFGKRGEIKKVSLSWSTKNSDFPMQSYHLSDGSIRFICLAVVLLQPNPPSMLIIDEPELGLHPEAIRILGELINDAAKRTQVIVATQSPLLVDQFAVEDVVVVNRKDEQSVFERLKQKDFKNWLEDYSVGELWTKNILRGGVNHE